MSQLLVGLLPLIAFYVAESQWGLEAGVAVAMVVVVADLGWRWFRHRRVDRVLLVSAALVLGLGGLSLLSRDERFVLYTPVFGDVLMSALLLGAVALGRSPLEAAMREQAPDIDVHPLQARFLRGLTIRLGVNLLAHAAITAWAASQPRETWLLVSGPVQYAMLGVQVAAEVAWGRLVLLPRVEAAEDAEAAAAEAAAADAAGRA